MFGDVPVQQSAGPNVEYDEDVDESEPRCDDHEEIAGEQLSGMIADEGAPRLCRVRGLVVDGLRI
jgi:hypothetical protein